MRLIFVHFIGTDYEGNNIYEFLFSEDYENCWGEDWDVQPANGNPKAPRNFVAEVGRFINPMKFDLVKDSETFDMMDCKEGVIALAWEDVLDYEEVISNRLVFHYGETKDSVDNKFYARDLILKYKNELTHV